MTDLTHLLEVAAEGDRQAAAELLPLVDGEPRELATARMAAESPGHPLDATALVHEDSRWSARADADPLRGASGA